MIGSLLRQVREAAEDRKVNLRFIFIPKSTWDNKICPPCVSRSDFWDNRLHLSENGDRPPKAREYGHPVW